MLQGKIINQEQLHRALDYQKENPEIRVGVALAKLGFVDIKTIVKALAQQKPLIQQDFSTPPKQESPTEGTPPEQSKIMSRLGEILLMDNVITHDELRKALEYQQKYPGMMFGQSLINLGFADKKTISKALLKTRQPT